MAAPVVALHDELKVPMFELCSVLFETGDWSKIQARFGLGWDPHLGAEAHRRWAESLFEVRRAAPAERQRK
jgi:hypothetical protein